MDHKIYKELLVLSAYDEADDAEKRILERHFKECPECRDEFAEINRLKLVSTEAILANDISGLLDDAQGLLDNRLSSLRSGKHAAREFITSVWKFQQPGLRIAFSSAAVLVIAIGVYLFALVNKEGNTGLVLQNPSISSLPGPGSIASVAPPHPTKQNKEETPSHAAVAKIQRTEVAEDNVVPVNELYKSDNPGVRLKAISAVYETSRINPQKKLKKTLLEAMQMDENPGVRREAMKALAKFPFDAEIRDALLYVLRTDKNAGLRIMAIDNLARKKDVKVLAEPATLTALEDRANQDGNSYVKLRAKSILTRIKS
jgi:hypothetical protein